MRFGYLKRTVTVRVRCGLVFEGPLHLPPLTTSRLTWIDKWSQDNYPVRL